MSTKEVQPSTLTKIADTASAQLVSVYIKKYSGNLSRRNLYLESTNHEPDEIDGPKGPFLLHFTQLNCCLLTGSFVYWRALHSNLIGLRQR